MPFRAYWKGYLRLSLVTIGVELYSAVSGTASPSFHQIHKPSGKRIRYQKVAPGVGPVERDEIAKGYEIDKGEYVLVEPDELDEIKLESKRTIELVQFVERCEIDPLFYDRPYYVTPSEEEVAAEGFAVIREALRDSGKVGLGQMAVRGRDYVVAIKPCDKGLLLETLRYAEEVRQSGKIFSDIPDVEVDADMLNLAEELIDRKTAPFHPESFHSQYARALRELIDEKRKTGRVTAAAEEELAERGGKVIDLMEALKKSVARDRERETGAAKKKAAKRKPARRKAG